MLPSRRMRKATSARSAPLAGGLELQRDLANDVLQIHGIRELDPLGPHVGHVGPASAGRSTARARAPAAGLRRRACAGVRRRDLRHAHRLRLRGRLHALRLRRRARDGVGVGGVGVGRQAPAASRCTTPICRGPAGAAMRVTRYVGGVGTCAGARENDERGDDARCSTADQTSGVRSDGPSRAVSAVTAAFPDRSRGRCRPRQRRASSPAPA